MLPMIPCNLEVNSASIFGSRNLDRRPAKTARSLPNQAAAGAHIACFIDPSQRELQSTHTCTQFEKS